MASDKEGLNDDGDDDDDVGEDVCEWRRLQSKRI